MPGNPTIGIQFNYKKALDSMMQELERRFKEIDNLGDNVEFSNVLKEQISTLKDQYAELKTYVSDTVSQIGSITREQFSDFQGKIDKRFAKINETIKSTNEELGSMRTKVGNITGTNEVDNLTNGFTQLQTKVRDVDNTVSELFGLIQKNSTDIPKIDLADESELALLERVKSAYEEIIKSKENIEGGNTKDYGFGYSRKKFKDNDSALKELEMLYTKYRDLQVQIDKNSDSMFSVDESEAAYAEKKLYELNAILLETHQRVEAIKTILVENQNTDILKNELNYLNTITNKTEKIKVGSFLQDMSKDMESYLDYNLKDIKQFVDQGNDMINSELFQIKDGKISVPLKLDATLETLKRQLDGVVKELQTYSGMNPVYITLAAKEVKKEAQGKAGLSKEASQIFDTSTLATWDTAYDKVLGKLKTAATTLKENFTPPLQFVNPANLETIVNKISELSELKPAPVIDSINSLKLNDENTAAINSFGKALTTLMKGVNGVNADSEALSSAKENLNIDFSTILPNFNGEDLKNKLASLSTALSEIKPSDGASTNIQGLRTLVTELAGVIELVPPDLTAITRLRNAVDDANKISVKAGIADNSEELKTLADNISYANGKFSGKKSNFVVSVNGLNDITVDGNDVNKKVKGLGTASETLEAVAKRLASIEVILTNGTPHFGDFIRAINTLSGLTISGADLKEKISSNGDLKGVFETLAKVAPYIAIIESNTPSQITNFPNLAIAINSLGGITVNASEVASRVTRIGQASLNIARASVHLATISNNIIKYKSFAGLVETINSLGGINLDSEKLLTNTQSIIPALTAFEPLVTSVSKINNIIPSKWNDFNELVKAINSFNLLSLDASTVASRMADAPDAFTSISAIVPKLADINKAMPKSFKDYTELINAINSFNSLTISGADLGKKTSGLPSALEAFVPISENVAKINSNIPDQFKSFQELVNNINIFSQLSLTGDDLAKKLSGMSDAFATLAQVATNAVNINAITEGKNLDFENLIYVLNTLKLIDVDGNSLYAKLDEIDKALSRLVDVTGRINAIEANSSVEYPKTKAFIEILNAFNDLTINGKDLSAKTSGLKASSTQLKDFSTNISEALSTFTVVREKVTTFIAVVEALNEITFSTEKISALNELPDIVESLRVATKLLPQEDELNKFYDVVFAINKLTDIRLDTKIKDRFSTLYAIAASIKRSLELIPDNVYSLSAFSSGVNSLNTISVTDSTIDNIVAVGRATKEISGIMSNFPTDYSGFVNFVSGVRRLNNLRFNDNFTTKFGALYTVTSQISKALRNLPTNYSSLIALANGVKAINDVKLSIDRVTAYSLLGNVLPKYRDLTGDFNSKGLYDLGEFLLTISDTNITKGSVNQIDRLPGIFERIKKQIATLPEGADKFINFMDTILKKKQELSDLATILKSGILQAKKANDLLTPKPDTTPYDSIAENYKNLITLQKQLANVSDDETKGKIRERIATLEKEITDWENVIKEEHLANDELTRRNELLKNSYQSTVEATNQSIAESYYKPIIDKYKMMIDLRKQLNDTENTDTISAINEQIESLESEISHYEELIKENKAFNEELDKQVKLIKTRYSATTDKATQDAQKKADAAAKKEEEAKEKQRVADDKAAAKEAKEFEKAYDDLVKAAENYYKISQRLTKDDKNENKDITARKEAYDELISAQKTYDALKQSGLLTDEEIAAFENARIDGQNDLFAAYSRVIKPIKDQYELYKGINGQSKEYQEKLSVVAKILNEIDSIFEGSNDGIIPPEEQDRVKDLIGSLSDAADQANRLYTPVEDGIFSDRDLKRYISSLNDVDKDTIKVKKDNDTLTASYKNLRGDIVTTTWGVDNQTQSFKLLNQTIERTSGLAGAMSAFGEIFKSFGTYLSAAMLVRRFFGEIRNGFETVKEIDKQFTEMRKVSDETIQSLREYVKESYEVAKANGSTATTILSSTADYMRLGKTLNEASELAKNTAILMNVSEFENINEATDALISMTQAYQEVETGLSSLDIIDKLNNIGNKFSISTSDLAKGLQRAAGTLMVAGNDIDEAIALMVGGNAIMQDPLKVAAGLRTISLRITGTEAAKKELEELGEDVDDFVITTASKLNDKVKGLTKTMTNQAGVSLLDMQGNYRSTYEILSDIANIWEEIKAEDAITGENRQNALLELLAGKNRSNVLASIFESSVYDEEAGKMIKLIDSVYAKSQDSAGSAMKEQEKYLDSLEGRLNVLTTSAQEFWSSFINSDFAKEAVSLLTNIVQMLTKVADFAGPIDTTVGLIATLLSLTKGIKITDITSDILLFIKTARSGGDALDVLGKSGSAFGAAIAGASDKLKAFAINLGILGVSVFVINLISSAFDKLYNSVSEYTQQIEETERALENVNREYNVLLEKGKLDSLTSAEKIRTEELKTQTEYLERQLKLRKQERAEALFNTNLGASLDKDSFISRFQEETKTIKSISEVISGYQNNTGIFEIFGGRYRFFGTEEKALEHYQNLLKQSRTDIELEQIKIVESIQEIQSYMREGILDESTLPKAKERLAEYKQALEESFYIIKEDQTRHGVYDISSYLKDHADIIRTLSRDSRSGKVSLNAFRESFGYLYDEASMAGLKWEQILDLIGDKQTADNANKPIAKLSDAFNALNSQISKTSEEMGAVSDAFDKATSSINALREAQEKLKDGELTQEDVLSLIKDNPKLAASIDWNDVNFGGLGDAITAEIERVRQQEIQELEARQAALEDLMAPPEITDDIKLFYEQYNSAIDGLSNFGISDKTNVFQGFENQVDEALRGYGAEVREINGEKVAYIPYSLYWDVQNPTKVSDTDVEDYLNEIMNGEDNGEHRVGLFPILKMGEDAEEVAKKYNAAVNYQQSYDDLLKACGNDSEALSVATNILGSDMSAVSEEYAVNAARLEYLKKLMGTHTKTVSDLHEEYDTAMGKISNLDSAIEKLLSKQMKDSDVIDLMLEFKELAGFDDIDLNDKVNFGNLLQRLMQLRNNLPTPLIKEMQELRDQIAETASQKTLDELDTLIAGLQRAVTFDVTGSDAFTQAISDAFGRTNSTVQSTLSYYEDLAKLQEAIADGFVMDAEKAWELAQMFPELSKGIMEYGVAGDGLVELNQEIVEGLLEGGDTAIDATVKQLQAEKELLIAKKNAAETELQVAIDALNSKDRAQKQAAVVEVERYLEVGKQKLEIEQEVDEGVAQSDQDQIDNHGLVARMVGKVSKFFSENMGQAAQDASQSVSDSSEKMQWSLANIVDAAKGAWAAVKSIGQNVFGGFKSVVGGAGGSTIFSRVKGWFGNFTSGVAAGVESLQTTVTNFADAAWDTSFGVNSRLEELIADLHIELGNYDDAIAAIDGQITTLLNLQGNAAERIKRTADDAGSGSGSDSDGSDAAEKEFSETFDWIERAIEVLEKAIDRLSTAAGNVYTVFSKRNRALLSEMDKVREEIGLQQAAYETYLAIAESIDLSEEYKTKVQQGLLQVEIIENEELAEKINLYKEWYDKAIDAMDAIQDLQITLGDLAKQKFDDIAKNFEDNMSLLEHRANMVNGTINQASERGFIAAVEYYEALTDIENDNLTALNEEREALIGALADAVRSGAVEEGSEAWYEMQNQVHGVTEAIQESETALISYANSIRDIQWEIFDRVEDSISQITEETEFLIGLLNDDKNFDGGEITKQGQAVYGLHAVNYQVYMEQAADYAREITQINKDLAVDPYDTVLIDRRKELLGLQRDMIQSAEDEKDAMKDLTEEGVQSFLDTMKDAIDTYKDMMSEWNDDRTFQKNIEEQTTAIATLQKQLDAYAGDDSEAGMLNRQQTQKSLLEAREKLEESQRDYYMSETEKMLDNLYDEAESALNARLDDFESLLTQIFDGINANSESIAQTLKDVTADVYTELSESMNQIWTGSASLDIQGQTTAITDVLSTYGEKIGTVPNNVSSTIDAIAVGVKVLSDAAEAEAKAKLHEQNKELDQTTVTKDNASKLATADTASSGKGNGSKSVADGQQDGSGANAQSGRKANGDFWIFKKDSYPKNKLNVDTSVVDRIKYHDFDSSFQARALYYEAMGLGSASSYNGSAAQNMAMLRWMKNNGFKRGLRKSSMNQWAMTQENGMEIISRPGLGLLTPVAKNDTIFNAEQTKALWEMSRNYIDQFSKAPRMSGTNIGQIVNNNSINISVDHVADYNELVTQAKADPKFERLIKSMSTDQLNGKPSIAKRRINF